MCAVRRKVMVMILLLMMALTTLGAPVWGSTILSVPNLTRESLTPDYGIQATVNGGQVLLTWTAQTAPAGKQLTGYHVYRLGAPGDLLDQSNRITEFILSKTSIGDNVSPGHYYYVVQATYSDGSKALASRAVEVNTQAAAVRQSVSPSANALSTPVVKPERITPSLPGGIMVIDPNVRPGLVAATIPVAFSAVGNRYTGVDPATVFDLNGDLVGDLEVSSTAVTAQNGAQLQLLDPAELNLDNVNVVPEAGYGDSSPLQLARAYVARLSGGGYAKFMVLQVSPKVTIWFMFGTPTTSVLTADGANSRVSLTWDALPDATLGYNIYRYEVNENSYTVTLLNDWTVQGTTFTDDTAANRYYLYVVLAIKSGGSFGSLTTVAPVFVTHREHILGISLANHAKLDGTNVSLSTPPALKSARLMVPASLFSYTGAKVVYDQSTGLVTLTRRLENVTYAVVMTVDNPDYTWNGTTYKTDVPPYLLGGEVMVPLRVVASILGLGVSFNSEDRTATIQWYE